MQTSLITKLAQNGQIKPTSPVFLTSEAAQPSRIRFTNAVNSMLQEQKEREYQEQMEQEKFQYYRPHTERFNFPKVTVEDEEKNFNEYATDGGYHSGNLKQPHGPSKNLSDEDIVHSGHLTHRAHQTEIRISAQVLRIVICIMVGTLALTMFIKIMNEEKRIEMLMYQVTNMKQL